MSTDDRSPENELICEKLLGWVRAPSCGEQEWLVVENIDDVPLQRTTPSFATWAEAGLILDALAAKKLGHYIDRLYEGGYRAFIDKVERDFIADTGPLAMRAAALAYVTRFL